MYRLLTCPPCAPPSKLEHGLAPSKPTQRHGALPCHTPQRIRHERHDDVIVLHPRVSETLDLYSLEQTTFLVGTPLLPVDRFPTKGATRHSGQNFAKKKNQVTISAKAVGTQLPPVTIIREVAETVGTEGGGEGLVLILS